MIPQFVERVKSAIEWAVMVRGTIELWLKSVGVGGLGWLTNQQKEGMKLNQLRMERHNVHLMGGNFEGLNSDLF